MGIRMKQLELEFFVQTEERLLYRVTVPFISRPLLTEALCTSFIIGLDLQIKGFYFICNLRNEIRKDFAIVDKITRQLIFYDFIYIVQTSVSCKILQYTIFMVNYIKYKQLNLKYLNKNHDPVKKILQIHNSENF